MAGRSTAGSTVSPIHGIPVVRHPRHHHDMLTRGFPRPPWDYPMCTSQGEIQMVVGWYTLIILDLSACPLLWAALWGWVWNLSFLQSGSKATQAAVSTFPPAHMAAKFEKPSGKTVWQSLKAQDFMVQWWAGQVLRAAITSPTYAPMSWCSNPNQSWSPFIIEGGRIKAAKLLQEPHPSCTPVASFLSCCKVQQP